MKLVPKSDAYRRASVEADLARSSFFLALGRARSRLHPRALKQDAQDKIVQAAHDAQEATVKAVREHPVITGGTFAVVLAILFRRPIWMAVGKGRDLWARTRQSRQDSEDTGDEQ